MVNKGACTRSFSNSPSPRHFVLVTANKVPKPFYDRFAHVGDDRRRRYLSMVHWLDAAVSVRVRVHVRAYACACVFVWCGDVIHNSDQCVVCARVFMILLRSRLPVRYFYSH